MKIFPAFPLAATATTIASSRLPPGRWSAWCPRTTSMPSCRASPAAIGVPRIPPATFSTPPTWPSPSPRVVVPPPMQEVLPAGVARHSGAATAGEPLVRVDGLQQELRHRRDASLPQGDQARQEGRTTVSGAPAVQVVRHRAQLSRVAELF